MNWSTLLLPFVFIYKGFITILLLPYYVVLGFVHLFTPKKRVKNEKKIISEIKKGEKPIIVKEQKSVYDKKQEIKKIEDPGEVKKQKDKLALKKQKEFEKMVERARQEEIKKIKEQEKIRIENEKKNKEKLLKEQERLEKERKWQESQAKKEDGNNSNDSFLEKINLFFKKLSYSKKEELKLQAKKTVLDEQFKDKDNKSSSRMTKPILFEYLARNNNGILEKGTISALSRVDVHSFLLAEGYEVYDITVAKIGNVDVIAYRMKKSRLIFYLSQLSAYLKSGIALAEAVKIINDQSKNKNDKKVWKAVYYDLYMGDGLSLAMEKRGETFPKLLINMIKTAEMTGNLSETLDDMVEYYSETESNRKQVISALTYPAIVLVFAIIVVAVILVVIVPSFETMYDDMGESLPAITVFILNVSDFLTKKGYIILLAIIALCLLFMYLYKNVRPFRKNIQEILMHIPVVGNIIIYNEVTIFSKTFANLINHNIFITDSIDVLSKVTNNEVYRKLIYDTAKNLTKGEGVSSAFKDHWAFPAIAYQMLLTGEKTGRLGQMMERVASYYEEQHKTIVTRMKSLIEPVVVVFLAVVVGGILLSVIIPMFDLYGSMQK